MSLRGDPHDLPIGVRDHPTSVLSGAPIFKRPAVP
jgi:hypothetical protein